MKSNMTKVVAVILLLIGQASGFSSGAANAACANSSMIPRHNSPAQTSPPPYDLAVSSNQYTAGGSLTLTLRGTQPFKGFLVLALPADDPRGENIGSFEIADNSQANLAQSVCNGGLTHTSAFSGASSLKDSVELTWRAPATGSGDVQFYATVVQRFDTFWAKIPFAVVTEAGGQRMTPMIRDLMTPEAITRAHATRRVTVAERRKPTRFRPTMSQPTTTRRAPSKRRSTSRPTVRMVTDPHPIAPITTDTCDVSKNCWRYENSPEAVLTWTARPDGAVDFELSGLMGNGQNYLALGLSTSPQMRDVSIIACTADSHRVSRVEGYYAAGRNSPSHERVNPIRHQEAAIQTGNNGRTMSCRFTYDNRVALHNLAKWKDLREGLYAFIARGDYSPRRLHKHDRIPIISASTFQFLSSQHMGVATESTSHSTPEQTNSPFYIWPCNSRGHFIDWCFWYNHCLYYARKVNPQNWY